jgi:hypothetical protein
MWLRKVRNAPWPDVVMGGVATGVLGGSVTYVIVQFWPEVWW